MKEGWNRKRLGDVLDVQNGYAFPSENFNPSRGLPLIRVRSLKHGIETETRFEGPYEEKYVVNEGDLLIGMDGEFGCYEWKGGPSLLNQRVCRLQGFSGELLPRFLFYGLNDYLKAIEDVTGFATVKHLSSKQILAIQFPVPPLPEQQRIVALLDEAFVGLATAKANAERNLQNARAIFESHLESIYSQPEEGWTETRLGDLCQIKTGKKDVNQGNPEGEYPFFTCAASHTFSDSYSFDAEALLIAGNGNVGQVSYYFGKFEAYQRTYVLFDFEGVTGKYLFHALDKRLSATVTKQKLGNTMPYIKIGMLTDFTVPIPPPKEQEHVTDILSTLAAETQHLTHLYERKLAALEELKQSLLQQAFNGEL